MELIPYVVAYLGVAVFLVAVIARFAMWARMPMHVRWELYPVAHEGKRARHGGSYLEEPEWWTHKREVSKISEAKSMAAEIVFLVAVKEHNPRLWTRTFPFHFGLYLIVGCTAALVLSGILAAVAPGALTGAFGTVLGYAIIGLGYAGMVLGLVGSLGLLARRLGDPEIKDYTTGADIFNLLFFIVAFGCALVTAVVVDPDFTVVGGFVANLLTLNFKAFAGSGIEVALPMATVVLLSLLLAYIPLTHMSHFVGKYFAYHDIRWNDTPNLAGGPEEGKIQEVLSQPVSWAAPHIKGDGKKTWVDVATEEMSK
jgi:nitrate reductase gamma subunit